MINYTEKDGAVTFSVRVAPRASKSEITGEFGGALKIRIAAAPIDGAANAELIKLLAKTFAISKSAIEIVVGETAKTKLIKISGIDAAKLKEIAG